MSNRPPPLPPRAPPAVPSRKPQTQNIIQKLAENNAKFTENKPDIQRGSSTKFEQQNKDNQHGLQKNASIPAKSYNQPQKHSERNLKLGQTISQFSQPEPTAKILGQSSVRPLLPPKPTEPSSAKPPPLPQKPIEQSISMPSSLPPKPVPQPGVLSETSNVVSPRSSTSSKSPGTNCEPTRPPRRTDHSPLSPNRSLSQDVKSRSPHTTMNKKQDQIQGKKIIRGETMDVNALGQDPATLLVARFKFNHEIPVPETFANKSKVYPSKKDSSTSASKNVSFNKPLKNTTQPTNYKPIPISSPSTNAPPPPPPCPPLP